jgi:HK97 family phage major capsid protein
MTALTVEQVRTMNLPQLHAEIADRWSKAAEIDKRYPNGLTRDDSSDDFDQQKQYLGDIDLMETRTVDLEDARLRSERISGGLKTSRQPSERHIQPADDDRPGRRMTLGERFTRDDGYQSLVKRGAWSDPQPRISHVVSAPEGTSMVAELKALVTGFSDTSGGAFVITDRQAYVPQLYADLTLLDLLPVVSTTSDLVDWVRESSFTNAAAPTLEATASTGTTGTKPESAIAFEIVSEAVQSIPHWLAITTRAMADAGQLRGIIDGELLLGIRRVLENQCLNGSGTAPNLRGIFNTTNVQTTAAGANLADAFFTAQMLVRTNGLVSPTANVMDAAAWSAIRLARENAATGSAGGYLMGSPGMVAPMTLWGLPVVLNELLLANNGLVGDFTAQSITLFERAGPTVSTGWINDQFVRNIVTILAEGRWALATKRPTSFCKVTGLP